MRKLILTCFFLKIIQFLNAQEKIFEHELNIDRRLAVRSFVTPLQNEDGFILTLIHRDNVKRFAVSPSGKTKKLISQTKTGIKDDFPLCRKIDSRILNVYNKQIFLTGFFINNKVIDVFPTFSNYIFIETDLASGNCSIIDSIRKTADEEFVNSFSKDNKMYLITHLRNSFKILVRKKEILGNVMIDTIDVNPEKKDPKAKLVYHFFKNKDLLVTEENLWLPINALFYDHRAYITEQYLKITFNAVDGSTWLVTVNLENSDHSIEQFNQRVENETSNTSNSLLIDSVLICSYATKKCLYTRFYNIRTHELIKQDSITADIYQQLASSQITKSRNFWSASNIEEASFESFLKAAAHNQLRMSGYKNGNEIHLTYGTKHDRITSLTFLANLVSLGIFSFSETKGPPVISFDVYYKNLSEQVEGKKMENLVWDKILMFAWGQRNYLNSTSMFHQGEYYFISHYNSAVKKYFMHRFREAVQ